MAAQYLTPMKKQQIDSIVNGLSIGLEISVPHMSGIMGETYVVGIDSGRNIAYGRYLGELAQKGLLREARKVYEEKGKTTKYVVWKRV